jgi:hypothetical protein
MDYAMFDMPVFVCMSALAVAANAVAIPKLMAYSEVYRDARTQKISLLAALTKGTLLAIGACALGSFAAPRAGLSAPFIEAMVYLNKPHMALWSQLAPALINSLYVLLGLMFLQITFVNRHISTARYFSIPLSAKILAEGVVEEFIYRWGLMSVVVRILNVEFLADPNAAMILAIILAAVGSSLSHVSDLSRLNFDRISMALLAVILINFWAAICYGWLFWKYGLSASILCHAMVVIVSAGIYKIGHFFSFQESDSGA